MPSALETIKKVIENIGLEDLEVSSDENSRRVSVIVNSDKNPYVRNNLQKIVQDFNLIAQLIAKRNNEPSLFVDINNYRLERERIIIELARAAARKVMATKTEVFLPAMNAYERRLVHMELVAHPGVKTESSGLGKNRYVVIKVV